MAARGLNVLILLQCLCPLYAARVKASDRLVSEDASQAGTAANKVDESLQSIESLAQESEGNQTWDGCSYELSVGFSHGSESASWTLPEWENEYLFKKVDSYTGCVKRYLASCTEGKVVVLRERCGDESKEEWQKPEARCLGGLRCMYPYRKTDVSQGEHITLHIPTATGKTCDWTINSGSVTYSAVKSGGGGPSGTDLATVAQYAADLQGRENEIGACDREAMAIRLATGTGAATILSNLELDVSKKANAAGEVETQTLASLASLAFHELKSESGRDKAVTKLAQDIRDIKSLKSVGAVMGSLVGSRTTTNTKDHGDGMNAIGSYFHGRGKHPQRDRRALIFTCAFGGGHLSAAKAVKNYLKEAGFEAQFMDTTEDSQFYDWRTKAGAHVFNEYIIARQNYKVFNAMDKFNQWKGLLVDRCPNPQCNTPRKQQFRTAILEYQPELIVTVYHMELMPILELANELGNIPVLHVATDMDIKMKEILPGSLVYPKFTTGVPFMLDESYATIPPLEQSQTFLSGYPVRSSFLLPYDETRIAAEKAKFLPPNTKMLLVMTGGGGKDKNAAKWPSLLAKKGVGQGTKLHVVVIAGKDDELEGKLGKKLEGRVSFPDGRKVMQGKDPDVTVEIARDPKAPSNRPFFVLEERMALLMDMADVMFSKPGGGSTAEIAYRGVPAIFDISNGLFHWEMFTVNVFVNARRGLKFSGASDFRNAIREAMNFPRSQSLAQDGEGKLINPKERVVAAANNLLTVPCPEGGCHLFAGEEH